tara:strand:+ start:4718 stop:5200 length:483 start_codon:yes stop_codon:yes gene_type:complete
MLKKAILMTALLSTSAFAGSWSHIDFPKENSTYHSMSTMDTSGEVKIDFACLSGLDTKVLTLSGVMTDEKEGTLKFYPSSKDKIKKVIEGNFKVSEDGRLDVLIGETEESIMSYFKLLHEVNLELKTKNNQNYHFTFNLKGSSKNLNIFESKCDKMNAKK